MGSNSMRWRQASVGRLRRLEWGAVLTWAFGFGLVAYLGLEGGGYDPLVHDQIGIAACWILLAGVSVGAFPRQRLSTFGWALLALLAGLAAWTAAGLIWSESGERTFAEVARVATYLGVFALALLSLGKRGDRRLLGAVAAGIAFVAIVALLSRLHPAWFPEADQTARFLSANTERLSYPLDYWNGLAALIAIGIPLLLHLASAARSPAGRGLAAAALPPMALTAFFTLSRGGIAAAAMAALIFLALAPNRLVRLASLALAGIGSVILIVAAAARQSLEDGLMTQTARDQGDEMLLLTLLVCVAVGLSQLWLTAMLRRGDRERRLAVPPRPAAAAAGVSAAVLLVVLLAVGAPGRVADGWDEFKQPSGPGSGSGRLGSAAGQSRYQYWGVAVEQNASRPLTGTGAGTFEFWWSREGDNDDTVRDAHSLYMQTLGELGIVGLALLAAFLGGLVVCGVRELIGSEGERRALLAAALAGCGAFGIAAAFDWMWQLPVVPVSMLLLGAILVAGQRERQSDGAGRLGLGARVGIAAAAAIAIVAIAIPLASTSLLRQSEAEARAGDLTAALERARSAQNAQPGAAGPRLQQALLLERLGDLPAAAAAARAAIEREDVNWRNWLVLSRIEAQMGEAAASVRAFQRARSLNPRSPIFDR